MKAGGSIVCCCAPVYTGVRLPGFQWKLMRHGAARFQPPLPPSAKRHFKAGCASVVGEPGPSLDSVPFQGSVEDGGWSRLRETAEGNRAAPWAFPGSGGYGAW